MPKGNKCVSLHIENGSVVQLDRIADSGSVGWGFESLRSHKKTRFKPYKPGLLI